MYLNNTYVMVKETMAVYRLQLRVVLNHVTTGLPCLYMDGLMKNAVEENVHVGVKQLPIKMEIVLNRLTMATTCTDLRQNLPKRVRILLLFLYVLFENEMTSNTSYAFLILQIYSFVMSFGNYSV